MEAPEVALSLSHVGALGGVRDDRGDGDRDGGGRRARGRPAGDGGGERLGRCRGWWASRRCRTSPLTIPARQTEATATFTLTPADDVTAAADETVAVGGTASLPWIAVEAATLDLLDNDEASTALLLTATPGTVAEGGGATQVTVTATLDGAARNVETEVTVTVSGPDTAGVEFAAIEPVPLTIAAGGASGSATFTLTPDRRRLGPHRHRRLPHRRRRRHQRGRHRRGGRDDGTDRARLGPRDSPPHRRRRGVDPRLALPLRDGGGGSGRRHRR